MRRKSIYEWALEYTGDPRSHAVRGELILTFLKEQGLQPNHRVLDLGCGSLSQGVPLIHYLDIAKYTGVDPNGWLIEAALQQHPELEHKAPKFSYVSDFAVGDGPYDYVVAHSVLSHVADWQLDLAFANIRAVVEPGAIWLASLRLDQYDLHARRWVYPGVSYFRRQTVVTRGYQHGWDVSVMPEYRKRLEEVAPNDFHDWVRLTARITPEEVNVMRLDEDIQLEKEREILEIAENEYRRMKEAQQRQLEAECSDS